MAAFPRAACVSVCPGPTYTLHVIYLLGSVRARQNSPGFAPDGKEKREKDSGAIISCLPENKRLEVVEEEDTDRHLCEVGTRMKKGLISATRPRTTRGEFKP